MSNAEEPFDSEQFIEGLDALDYNRRDPSHLPRMSLYKQFDPLVNQTTPKPQPVAENNVPVVNDDNHDSGTVPEEETPNKTPTLIHLNTPMPKKLTKTLTDDHDVEINNEKTNIQTNGDNHPVVNDIDLHNQQQIVQMNEEIGNLEAKNETLELLIGQLTLFNQKLFEMGNKKITHLQELLEQKDEELNKLTLIKSQLEEDINGVEKNYYEIHSRYDNLRTLVVEMDTKESQNNLKIQELLQRLKDKEQECCRLRLQAEEAMQNVNQRQAANSENVSLKAQVKMLEMKVNSLQSQIEQKNKENEELTNIVEDLIKSNKN